MVCLILPAIRGPDTQETRLSAVSSGMNSVMQRKPQIQVSRLPRSQRVDRRAGLTVLELMVVMSIIGVLLGLVLPAVQAAREAARRVHCIHNLRQLGIAIHSYSDTFGGLPPGWQRDPSGVSAFGWAVSLLPFMEQSALEKRADSARPIDASENQFVREQTPSFMFCPSDNAPLRFTLFAENEEQVSSSNHGDLPLFDLPGANYVGVFGTGIPDEVPGHTGNGAFREAASVRLAEFQRGLSQSLWVGERTAQRLPASWLGFALDGEDAPGRVVGSAGVGPNVRDADECEFDSRHPGCANFLWGDGGARPIDDGIDRRVYRRLASRQGEGS